MIKVIGISGSPRKGGNTEILVKNALEAAKTEGADTEIILLPNVRHWLRNQNDFSLPSINVINSF